MDPSNQEPSGTQDAETADLLKKLETYGSLVSECNRYALLTRNAERNRHTVRPHIYARVKREYEERRETLGQEQNEQKEYLRTELEKILRKRKALNERCRQESDQLEELDFRVRVGEFAEDAVQDRRKELKEALLEITMALADAQEIVSKFEQVGLLAQVSMPSEEAGVGKGGEPSEDRGDFVVLEEDPSSTEDSPIVHYPAEPTGDLSEAETETLRSVSSRDASVSLQDNVFGYLVALDGSRQGERFPLISSELTVGSSPDIDIRLADSGIARVHARIVYENRRHYIETLEEPGGCLVNGIQKDKAELKDGDVLSLGEVKMQVEYAREANA
jgi:hypothetical protein